ncbi:MAG: pyridoxal-phosphate dependent enzyme, partial [Candidatus Nanopelagicales bacterium]
PRSHYESTGPEIWNQTDGKVTHFVAGIGTGGTISGTGKYLKEVSDGRVKIIGADPEGSIYSGGTGRPYLVEGVGEDFWPAAYNPKIVDEVIAVSDAESFEMTRRLAREEGLLVGGSCGMATVAALKAAKDLSEDDVVIVILPDSGRGYLSKIFNDAWLAKYGFSGEYKGEVTVGEVLEAKSNSLPTFVHIHPGETVQHAIEILREFSVSQIPVVKEEPPLMAAEVVGSINEKDLLQRLASGKTSKSELISDCMSPALPVVGAKEKLSTGLSALETADAVVVHLQGKPVGVLTRQDVLAFLTK